MLRVVGNRVLGRELPSSVMFSREGRARLG